MAVKRRYRCIVCGRVFPEGQGIVVRRAGVELAFHSKDCLAKFFKLFVEELSESEFKKAATATTRSFEEALKAKQKSKII